MSDADDLRTVSPRRCRVVERRGSARSAHLALAIDGTVTDVKLQRCVTGRLRNAYPVGERDVEVVLAAALARARRTEVLTDLFEAVHDLDPRCRRVVIATDAAEPDHLSAAEAAGFRYVVDVDLAAGEFRLAVAEPRWVTTVDEDLDRVPGS